MYKKNGLSPFVLPAFSLAVFHLAVPAMAMGFGLSDLVKKTDAPASVDVATAAVEMKVRKKNHHKRQPRPGTAQKSAAAGVPTFRETGTTAGSFPRPAAATVFATTATLSLGSVDQNGPAKDSFNFTFTTLRADLSASVSENTLLWAGAPVSWMTLSQSSAGLQTFGRPEIGWQELLWSEGRFVLQSLLVMKLPVYDLESPFLGRLADAFRVWQFAPGLKFKMQGQPTELTAVLGWSYDTPAFAYLPVLNVADNTVRTGEILERPFFVRYSLEAFHPFSEVLGVGIGYLGTAGLSHGRVTSGGEVLKDVSPARLSSAEVFGTYRLSSGAKIHVLLKKTFASDNDFYNLINIESQMEAADVAFLTSVSKSF